MNLIVITDQITLSLIMEASKDKTDTSRSAKLARYPTHILIASVVIDTRAFLGSVMQVISELARDKIYASTYDGAVYCGGSDRLWTTKFSLLKPRIWCVFFSFLFQKSLLLPILDSLWFIWLCLFRGNSVYRIFARFSFGSLCQYKCPLHIFITCWTEAAHGYNSTVNHRHSRLNSLPVDIWMVFSIIIARRSTFVRLQPCLPPSGSMTSEAT